MAWRFEQDTTGTPRVLLVSQRALSPYPSRSLRFDFEDRVREFDGVDLVAADRPTLPSARLRRVAAHFEGLIPDAPQPFARGRPRLAPRYELALVTAEALHDLLMMQPLRWLLGKARSSACFVDEVWLKGLRDRTGELRLFRAFDHIFLGTAGAVEEMAALTGRPCTYVPPSVDALSLCPWPDPPPRTIDVYSMGRRSAKTHEALLAFAERNGWFYLYDTTTASGAPSHFEHRRLLGSLLKRSRFLIAYPGKIDLPEQTGGQQEVGFRYFEGAAAGALLMGAEPNTAVFQRLFDWPDAVFPLSWDSTEVAPVLSAVHAQPERAEQARRRNVAESLLRHDHVYRWREILAAIGLPETEGMVQRRGQLLERAELVRGLDGGGIGLHTRPDAS